MIYCVNRWHISQSSQASIWTQWLIFPVLSLYLIYGYKLITYTHTTIHLDCFPIDLNIWPSFKHYLLTVLVISYNLQGKPLIKSLLQFCNPILQCVTDTSLCESICWLNTQPSLFFREWSSGCWHTEVPPPSGTIYTSVTLICVWHYDDSQSTSGPGSTGQQEVVPPGHVEAPPH